MFLYACGAEDDTAMTALPWINGYTPTKDAFDSSDEMLFLVGNLRVLIRNIQIFVLDHGLWFGYIFSKLLEVLTTSPTFGHMLIDV